MDNREKMLGTQKPEAKTTAVVFYLYRLQISFLYRLVLENIRATAKGSPYLKISESLVIVLS